MKIKTKKTLVWCVIAVVVIAAIAFFGTRKQNTAPGKLDSFAQCIKNSGATFYGAWWCPHCKDQKSLFGTSVQYLPYVECSTADGNGQTQICKDKNIQGYPTWVFADGSTQSGEIQLDVLAQKTGCTLPQ